MQQQNQYSISAAQGQLGDQTYEQLLQQGIDPLQAEIILGNLSDLQLESFIKKSRTNENIPVHQIINMLAQQKIYSYNQLLQVDLKKCQEFKIDQIKLLDAKKKKIQQKNDQFPIFNIKPRAVQSDQKQKTLLLLGQTGAGKSRFIDFLANYCYCKDQNVQYRVRATKIEEKKKQSESCTEKIETYVFINRRTNEQLILIDTPGFGDTGGFNVDLKITNELQSLLTNQLDSIDMICLIKKESDNRLDATNMYVLGKVFSLFANDMKKNVHLIFTNSQFSKQPQALNLFTEDPEFKKILHQMIQPIYSQVEMGPEALFDKDDESKDKLGKNFDRINKLWEKFTLLPPQSLLLTQKVLIDRQNLIKLADDLNNQLVDQLNKLDFIQKNYNIQGTNEQSIKIERFQIQTVNLKEGEFVTNCLVCRSTCHYPCLIEKDHKKYKCSAMKNSYCTQCIFKCCWVFHKNSNYRIVYSSYSQQLKLFKVDSDKLIQEYMENIQSYWKKYNIFVNCLEQIKENAMLPGSHSYFNDYILLQIKTEESQMHAGYKERISQLNSILKLFQKIQQEHKQLTGEQTLWKLLEPLQQIIDYDAFKAILEENKLKCLKQQ